MSAPITWADPGDVTTMSDLSPTARKFIRDWSDLADAWNVDRVTAEVQAYLWITEGPADLRAVASALHRQPDDVAQALEWLRERGIAKLSDTTGTTLRYYVPRDPCEMFLAILEERRRREIEPAVAVLRDAVLRADSDDACEDRTRRRLEEMQAFLRDSLGFYQQVSTMPGPYVRRMFKIGGKIRRALGLDPRK
jgi:DNA-binding transcriptional regulator GbsR (MarR family)